VQSLYSRTEADFNPGNFRIKGDTVDIYPSYADEASVSISLVMKSRRLKVSIKDSRSLKIDKLTIYPANMFVTSPDVLQGAIWHSTRFSQTSRLF
jgi:excinuclease ABC subunit B